MILHRSHSLYTHGVARSVHWLVLVVFMFGTIITAIGGMSSHGLAAFATALHGTPYAADEAHEHLHGDEDAGGVKQSAGADRSHHGDEGADHPHHGADHAHDNVHAVPAAWRSSAPQLAGWSGRVRPWIEMIQASRLERPPMG